MSVSGVITLAAAEKMGWRGWELTWEAVQTEERIEPESRAVVVGMERQGTTNKNSEGLRHSTAWTDIENIMLRERSQSQKTTGCMILFI